MSADLPTGKQWFRIGEVSELTGVPPHVLRYWEREIPSLRPHKSRSGHRIYSRTDVEFVLLVKRLLKEEGFTISGARRFIEEGAGRKELRRLLGERAEAEARAEELSEVLEVLRQEVLDALAELDKL